jgi:hypothetical protein
MNDPARVCVDARTDILVTGFGTLRAVRYEQDRPRDTRDTWELPASCFAPGYSRSDIVDLHQFDVKSNDRSYWQSVRRFLEWLALGLPELHRKTWARRAYKALRAARHTAQAKAWEEVLPREVVEWASERLRARISESSLDCVDNDRVARVGNTGQVRRYNRQRALGCCGFADWIETGPDGRRYMLGLNYGH